MIEKIHINIIREHQVWNAFLAILEEEEKKIYAQLTAMKEADQLVRLNAELVLLNRLKSTRNKLI